MALTIVILAAGQGTRMRSTLPKVLHAIAGKPLLEHVIDTAQQLKPEKIIVVYGHAGAQVRAALAHLSVTWVEQAQQLGTGHAVLQALPQIQSDARVLVLFGDVPLITVKTLQRLLAETPSHALGLITAWPDNPQGLGRVLRDEFGAVAGIVEEKDASSAQRAIQETNTGIALVAADNLQRWLPALDNHNAQAEYYFPAIIARALAEKLTIHTLSTLTAEEGQGVNDRAQLAQLERYYHRMRAEQFMLQGVTLLDPTRFDLRGTAQIAADVTIDINVILSGQVTIGAHTYIGPNAILRDVTLGEHVVVQANSVIEGAVLEDNVSVGPFARIRPGTKLKANARVGNFVEIKNTELGAGSKVNHLSYVGDATIGTAVNIGAGVITCNYDGVNKHKTQIEDEAFIGSNSALIAPITIGAKATVGAGSTLSGKIPPATLALTRAEQRLIKNWRRPKKIKLHE